MNVLNNRSAISLHVQAAWSLFTNYETVNKWLVIAVMAKRHPGGVMFPKTESLSLFSDISGPDGGF